MYVQYSTRCEFSFARRGDENKQALSWWVNKGPLFWMKGWIMIHRILEIQVAPQNPVNDWHAICDSWILVARWAS